jgi:hypothetical protein
MSLLISAITTGFLTAYTPAVTTRSTPVSVSCTDAVPSEKNKTVFDDLIDWGLAAQSGVNRFEFPAPTLASVNMAVKLITDARFPDSPSVAPNGDGGISFEWEQGLMLLHLNIDDQGNIEATLFSGPKIVYSQEFEARFFQ